MNCGGSLKKMVGISNMHNVFRLWNIDTDYPFTRIKDRGEVVGSLPTHNIQCTLLEQGDYICM